MIIKDKFEDIAENVYVATNDGTLGEKGFVTDILNKLIDELNLDKQEIEILNIYLSLSKEQRKSILNFIFEFSKKINEIS